MCRPQNWISEIESYQKMSSHAQIGPQGAKKQLSKVNVGGGGGGWYEMIIGTVWFNRLNPLNWNQYNPLNWNWLNPILSIKIFH